MRKYQLWVGASSVKHSVLGYLSIEGSFPVLSAYFQQGLGPTNSMSSAACRMPHSSNTLERWGVAAHAMLCFLGGFTKVLD
jgi:hypothetical protein